MTAKDCEPGKLCSGSQCLWMVAADKPPHLERFLAGLSRRIGRAEKSKGLAEIPDRQIDRRLATQPMASQRSIFRLLETHFAEDERRQPTLDCQTPIHYEAECASETTAA